MGGSDSIFDILGSKTYYFGELGKATGAKLVLNSLLGIFGEAYSEVLLLAQNFGIDTETIVNAISDSRMSSALFQEKKRYVYKQRISCGIYA